MLYTVLIVFHVVLAASLIAIILVQRGPGATMGAAFGSGASGTVFGSRGSASFLTRATSWLGVAFFGISLSMAVLIARSGMVGPAPDDLGVAAGIQTIPTEEQRQVQREVQREDDFLVVPVEEEEDEFIPEPPQD